MIFTKTHFSLTYVLFILCAGILISPASATDAYNSLLVTSSADQVVPGESFTVDVVLYPGESVSGAQFDISFSGADYIVDGIDEGDFFSRYAIPTAFVNTLKPDSSIYGTMYFAALGPYQVSMPGNVVRVQMIAGDSTGYLNIDLSDVIISNSMYQESPCRVRGAKVLVDSKPVLYPVEVSDVEVGNPVYLDLNALDSDNDDLSFSCSSLPEGASIDSLTGEFKWTPSSSQVGEHILGFEVKDGYLSDHQSVIISVNSSGLAPIANIRDRRPGTVGKIINLDGSRSYDKDGDIVSYKWEFGDGSVSDSVSSSHKYTASGNYVVLLTVTDDSGNTDTDSTTVRVKKTIWSWWN
jgi:hypothetical protein